MAWTGLPVEVRRSEQIPDLFYRSSQQDLRLDLMLDVRERKASRIMQWEGLRIFFSFSSVVYVMDSGATGGRLCLHKLRASLRVKSTMKKSKPRWRERQVFTITCQDLDPAIP